MHPTDSNGFSKFSSPRGWQICRKIITDRLPFGPHYYQLTKALDGQDVVAVSAIVFEGPVTRPQKDRDRTGP